MTLAERKQFYENRENILMQIIDQIEYLFTNDEECKQVTCTLQAAANQLQFIINNSDAHPERWEKVAPPVPEDKVIYVGFCTLSLN